ncbi:porin [Leptothrix ochracea]|uniref:porin n=1 Tax=Leptothrix ochracea TaxID=735331 RepID=UPI0034E1ADDE
MSCCRPPALRSLATLVLAMALNTIAQAQPVYALYGTLDVAVGSFQAAGSARLSQVQSGAMHTSFIGLKGEEALDSGAKVLFNLEGFLRLDSGESGRWTDTPNDGAWSRAANVGFAGSFGTVLLGRVPNLMFTHSRPFNSFSARLGDAPTLSLAWSDPRGSMAHIDGDTAWSNALSYVGRPQGHWIFALQSAAPEGNGHRNLGVNLDYNPSGPFKINAAWQDVQVGLGGQKESTGSLGLSYDAGPIQFYAQAASIDDRAQGSLTKVVDMSLALPMGLNHTLLLAWNHADLNTDRSQASTLRLGDTHDVSQRTTLYGVIQRDQRTGLAAGHSLAVGLRHLF